MDYDGGDFQSQDSLLNSEEIAKSLPVLSSFPVPKFDFDDDLRENLRFDNLVESGAFLGIESQEDNSWIEDYSRGSSGIVSASISRRDNVWSEATSLESVEMLLESVGRDENNTGENVVRDVNAVIELGSSTIQLAQNEEDCDQMTMEDVDSCLVVPFDELYHEFRGIDDSAVEVHQADDNSVADALCGNVKLLHHEIEVINECRVTENAQVIGASDNRLLDEKHELNQIKADSSSDIQVPVQQDDSQVIYTEVPITCIENLGSGQLQVDNEAIEVSQTVQINSSQDISGDGIETSFEGVTPKVLESDFIVDYNSSEGCTTEDVSVDFELNAVNVQQFEDEPVADKLLEDVELLNPETVVGIDECRVIDDDQAIGASDNHFLDEKLGLNHIEDEPVGDKMCYNVDVLHQETVNEMEKGRVAEDTEVIGASDNQLVYEKHELNQITADFSSDIQAPVQQVDSQVINTEVTIACTENQSSGQPPGNNADNEVNPTVDPQDFAEGSIAAGVQGVNLFLLDGINSTGDQSIEKENEKNQSMADSSSHIQAPVEQADSEVIITEGVCQGNDTGNVVNPTVQVDDAQDLSGGGVDAGIEGVTPMIFDRIGDFDEQLIDNKHERNLFKADSSSDIGAPVQQADSEFICIEGLAECIKNPSSGVSQGNDTDNKVKQTVLVSDAQNLSGLSVEADIDRVTPMVLERDVLVNYNHSEGYTAADVSGDFDHVACFESRGQVSASKTGNNNLTEPFGSSTKGHGDGHPLEICHSGVGIACPAKGCKHGINDHFQNNACESSNVTMEAGPTFQAGSPDSSGLNTGVCSAQNLCTYSHVPSGTGVQMDDEQCGRLKQVDTTPHIEKLEESLTEDIEMYSVGGEEDDDNFKNAAAFEKLQESMAGHDKLVELPSDGINRKVAANYTSTNRVCYSAMLASGTHANYELNVCCPAVSEEDVSKGGDVSPCNIVEKVPAETAAFVLSDANDEYAYSIRTHAQSEPKSVEADDNKGSTGGSLSNSGKIEPSSESVCNTQYEGSPCDSPSIIPTVIVRDKEEPNISPNSINNSSTVSREENEIGDNDGSLTYDGYFSKGSKAGDLSENDKSFSFVVGSSAEYCEKTNVNLWQPFDSQVLNVSLNEGDSPPTPGMEQNNLSKHQPAENEIVKGSISSSKRKPGRASGKTNTSKKETGKRESRKNTTLAKLKESDKISAGGSLLPDLNTASSMSTSHQQHFNDLQQLQLRAQIFVYGSLIQGTPPDEACMIAAFGGPGGGRSIWENARHKCLERVQGQKLQLNNPESPMQQQSGARAADHKVSEAQNRCIASPTGQADKCTPKHTLRQMAPPSSPLWTMQTPANRLHCRDMPRGTTLDHNVIPPLYPPSSSPLTGAFGHTTSWSPHPAPWAVAARTSAPNTSPMPFMLPNSDPVKSTAVKESAMLDFALNNISPAPVGRHAGHPNYTSGDRSCELDVKTSTSFPGKTHAEPKSREQKKVELGKVAVITEPRLEVESVSLAHVSSPPLTSVIETPACGSKVDTRPFPSSASSAHATKGNLNIENRIMFFEDICCKLDEAKLHAVDAAAHAAAAVGHSQEIWGQMAKQMDSGVRPDVDAKISSAALAVAAAVAVAKASAAAAKVASNAALQAKLMAEEAMDSSRSCPVESWMEGPHHDTVIYLGDATPTMVLKDANQSAISFNIMATRESARTMIEAASAASKRAENMDAIVKAAELAAEAITQAGKVVAMGDPLPLSQLLDAGPERCLKLPKLFTGQGLQTATIREQPAVDCNGGGVTGFKNIQDAALSPRETLGKSLRLHNTPKQTTEGSSEHLDLMPDVCKPPFTVIGDECGKAVGTSEEIPIKKGSLVEVYKKGDAVKAAWFRANVVDVKNGEAQVCYSEADGKKLNEWIMLDSQENEAPKIRAGHPMTNMPTVGTRKRRREALGKSSWSVGDKVDAWKENCWWEGVISEKHSKDDTAFTVHFPAQGETSIINVCHLRPSLIWQDGEWVECPSSTMNDGDMRQEKRLKSYDSEDKVNVPEEVDTTLSKMHEGSRLLGLSENEKKFDVGKMDKDDKKPVTHRKVRTAMQKEGLNVSFGVPKPGKKRKLVDVSHVSRDSKTNEGNSSLRPAKMLMPQRSVLPSWRSGTKIDTRAKPVSEVQSRLPNFRKPYSVADRSMDRNKDNVSSSLSRNNNSSKPLGVTGFASFSGDGRTRNPTFAFLSPSDDQSSKKFTASSKPEVASRSKCQPPLQKLAKIEEDKVYSRSASASESAEPRRSIRRINPTSRLLEGLQTSLSIPKLQPSASQDKGSKILNRSTSSRGNQ